MAIIAALDRPYPDPGHIGRTLVWSAIAPSDTIVPFEMRAQADRSVHVYGNFGGATVALQGSNEPSDPTSWVTLTGPGGPPLTFTATGLAQIVETTRWIRPSVSGGSAYSLNVAVQGR